MMLRMLPQPSSRRPFAALKSGEEQGERERSFRSKETNLSVCDKHDSGKNKNCRQPGGAQQPLPCTGSHGPPLGNPPLGFSQNDRTDDKQISVRVVKSQMRQITSKQIESCESQAKARTSRMAGMGGLGAALGLPSRPMVSRPADRRSTLQQTQHPSTLAPSTAYNTSRLMSLTSAAHSQNQHERASVFTPERNVPYVEPNSEDGGVDGVKYEGDEAAKLRADNFRMSMRLKVATDEANRYVRYLPVSTLTHNLLIIFCRCCGNLFTALCMRWRDFVSGQREARCCVSLQTHPLSFPGSESIHAPFIQ